MADFNTENSYIKILDREHGDLVQELLFKAGCSWRHCKKMVLDSEYTIHITDRKLTWSGTWDNHLCCGKTELKLSYNLVDSLRHKTKLGDKEYYTDDLLALAEGNGLQEANK